MSRVTVWKVLNDRPGVAPDTVQRVREAVERLQSAPDDAGELLPDLRPAQSVTLLAARADAAPFWMQIVDQIAADLSRRKIRLNYLPADVLNLSPGELASRIRREGADGVLVINIYERPLISALAAIPLPKVYLDAIPGLGRRTSGETCSFWRGGAPSGPWSGTWSRGAAGASGSSATSATPRPTFSAGRGSGTG